MYAIKPEKKENNMGNALLNIFLINPTYPKYHFHIAKHTISPKITRKKVCPRGIPYAPKNFTEKYIQTSIPSELIAD
jgi:hypothetical protein